MLLPFADKFSQISGKYKKCTLNNLYLCISALIVSKTVNLNKQKDYIPNLLENSKLKMGSCYALLVRFMKNYCRTSLSKEILEVGKSLLSDVGDSLYLDATEWKFGLKRIHILVLCTHWENVAIPVFFRPYWHKGVLSAKARIRFIRRAISYVALQGKILVADREFIGELWFNFLVESNVLFVIRIRENMYQKALLYGKNHHKLRKKALKKGFAQGFIKINDEVFRLEFWRNTNEFNTKEPIVYLLTNVLDQKKIGQKYKHRWRIEYCFKHLKSNGFDLEDMSWKRLDKIQLTVSIVILAYIVAVKEGDLARKEDGKIRTKKYKDGTEYPEISLFRTGYFSLMTKFKSVTTFIKYLKQLKAYKSPILQIV